MKVNKKDVVRLLAEFSDPRQTLRGWGEAAENPENKETIGIMLARDGQKYYLRDLSKKQVAKLVTDFSKPGGMSVWPVAEKYKILGGVIYVDDPHYDLRYLDAFSDPDLFLSFARLGARGEPSERSILRWVSEHGLLRRENEKHGPLLDTEVNQASITVDEFRAEVLCALQLLNLHMDIREENFAALQAKIYVMDEKRHLSSYWPNTPPTDLEKHFAATREANGKTREALLHLENVLPVPDDPKWTSLDRFDVFIALAGLQQIVKNRLANVRLDFNQNWTRFQPLGSDYRIPRSWYCPDLLSAMYLQLYLLITDFEPMRLCQNPACGMPFPATRKNRMYCNDTCRSNARHYR